MKLKLLAALLALPLLSGCVTVDTRTVSLPNGDARAELRLVEDMWLGKQSFELWGINNTSQPVCVYNSLRRDMSGAATYLIAPRSSRQLDHFYQARGLYLAVSVSPDGVSCPR
ncbi:MAG: hypothetical protein REJ23_16375 [Brevundimonas sp.]|nr:hypothetical protein [Brevundimonas sp.]